MPTQIEREFAIDDELRTSIRLISAGLGQLQSLHGGNDFYHQPFLSLASGFERFMKVIICLDYLRVNDVFPSDPSFFTRGRQGHDLIHLLERIRTECFGDRYLESVPVALDDQEYLMSVELGEFVSVLSRFGKSARYHDLDVILGGKSDIESPVNEWNRLETSIMGQNDWLVEIVENPAETEVYTRVTSEVVGRLERLARALARLFTIGDIGSKAQQLMGHVTPFLFLRDSDLGQKKYLLTGMRSK